jgi:hypothetical protein
VRRQGHWRQSVGLVISANVASCDPDAERGDDAGKHANGENEGDTDAATAGQLERPDDALGHDEAHEIGNEVEGSRNNVVLLEDDAVAFECLVPNQGIGSAVQVLDEEGRDVEEGVDEDGDPAGPEEEVALVGGIEDVQPLQKDGGFAGEDTGEVEVDADVDGLRMLGVPVSVGESWKRYPDMRSEVADSNVPLVNKVARRGNEKEENPDVAHGKSIAAE